MGNVMFMRKGEVHTAPFVPIGNPVFADNDWVTIVEACQNNRVPRTWKIGDQKTMTIDGADYAIDIIGKNHDEYSDGSGKAPLTFQMHGYYAYTKAMNSSATNNGGWDSSNMRKTTLPALLKTMPTEVKSALKYVNKSTSSGNKSTTIKVSEDRLFLLSEVEVFGTNTLSATGEGSQYEYYAAGNSAKKAEGSVVSSWFLRSPVTSSSADFCAVNSNGALVSHSASASQCVAFAFCF